MAWPDRCQNAQHRTRLTLGERLLRELQRQAARRIAEWRNLLHAEGGADRDRKLASALQQHQAPQFARLHPTGSASHLASQPRPVLRFNPVSQSRRP